MSFVQKIWQVLHCVFVQKKTDSFQSISVQLFPFGSAFGPTVHLLSVDDTRLRQIKGQQWFSFQISERFKCVQFFALISLVTPKSTVGDRGLMQECTWLQFSAFSFQCSFCYRFDLIDNLVFSGSFAKFSRQNGAFQFWNWSQPRRLLGLQRRFPVRSTQCAPRTCNRPRTSSGRLMVQSGSPREIISKWATKPVWRWFPKIIFCLLSLPLLLSFLGSWTPRLRWGVGFA